MAGLLWHKCGYQTIPAIVNGRQRIFQQQPCLTCARHPCDACVNWWPWVYLTTRFPATVQGLHVVDCFAVESPNTHYVLAWMTTESTTLQATDLYPAPKATASLVSQWTVWFRSLKILSLQVFIKRWRTFAIRLFVTTLSLRLRWRDNWQGVYYFLYFFVCSHVERLFS